MRRIIERWTVPGGTIAVWSNATGYWAKAKKPIEPWLMRGTWLWFGDDFDGAVAWLARVREGGRR